MKFIIRTITVFQILILPFSTLAFVNVEGERTKLNENLQAQTSLGLSNEKGNSDEFDFSTDIFIGQKSNGLELLGLAGYSFGENKNVKDTNDGKAHLRAAKDIWQPGLALEVFGQVEFDEFEDLNLRQVIGIGLRKNLFSSDSTQLFIGGGPMYENEDLANDPDEENGRMNSYVSLIHDLSKTSSLYLVSYFQPKINEMKDNRVQLFTGIDTKVTSNFGLNFEVHYQSDSRSPSGVKSYDIVQKASFKLKL